MIMRNLADFIEKHEIISIYLQYSKDYVYNVLRPPS